MPSKTAATATAMRAFVPPKSPYQKVAHSDIDFHVAFTVQDSWDLVTRIPNWEEVTGDIFLRRLFETSPQLQEIWGFGKVRPSKLTGDKFVQKGVALLLAVDKAVDMLGPDLEPLEQKLFDLGRRHIQMGAEPEYWPLVGDALMYTLRKGLGANFTELEEEAWTIIYNFMAYWMIEGLIAEKKDLWEADEKIRAEVQLEGMDGDEPPPLEKIDGRRSSSNSTMNSSFSSSYYAQRRRSSGSTLESSSSSHTISTRRSSANSCAPAGCWEWDEDLETNIYQRADMEEIDFTTVQIVLESWQKVLQRPNWQQRSAVFVLTRLFELVPELKGLWGFSPSFDPSNSKDPDYGKFVFKGLNFMSGVNKAVSFIGPDLEPLVDELKDLGRIHYLAMAAQPQFWPPVGVALMDTLEELLGPEDWKDDTKGAWGLIYHFMAYWMIEGLLAEKRRE